MLELKGVSKRYKKQTVFQDLNARFDTGVTILTGPSGVGKSTLLRLCASVENSNAGTVLWQGQPITKTRRKFRQSLGYAPQIIDFPEDLSANEFMVHIGALKGLKISEAKDQSQSILTRLGLAADGEKQIRSYSGGMRRRLGLAQAFLGTPECLIIDEPTAELDPETASRVHDFVFETAKQAVIVMTTHLESSLKNYTYQNLHMDGALGG